MQSTETLLHMTETRQGLLSWRWRCRCGKEERGYESQDAARAGGDEHLAVANR